MEEGAIWALALSLVSRCEIGKCPEMSTVDKKTRSGKQSAVQRQPLLNTEQHLHQTLGPLLIMRLSRL